MRNIQKILLMGLLTLAVFAGISRADTASGKGIVTGTGGGRGKGVAAGTGAARGKGIVIYRGKDGKLHVKKGKGTVSGKGVVVGKGSGIGKGKAGGKGTVGGKGTTNSR